ncbi:rubredoxin [Methanorbis furvi]|uniref:Rubredoxin n=1 Tax=Methanorbis furvi TaxID=3028299 RepID=A0AAE4S9U6_9EURY|nr:Rubredoxin [Methanocorpusculaceae archaeon Ag1]
MSKYKCRPCGYIYDEEVGDVPNVPPKTPFEKIPDTWECPVCGAGKESFAQIE